MRKPALAVAVCLVAGWGLVGTAIAAPPVEAYGHLPSVEWISLSPAGERYAFVVVSGESRKLVLATYDNKALEATAVGDTKVRGIRWADEGHVLLTTSSTFKDPFHWVHAYELDSVIDIRPDSHKAAPIFDKIESVANTVAGYFGTAQVDGHLFGYFGAFTFERGKLGDYYFPEGTIYPDLYRVDLESGKINLQADGHETVHDWVVARDGSILAHSEYDDPSGEWRLFAGKTRDKLLLKKISPTGDIDLFGPGRSDGTVLVVDRSGTEDVTLEISVADGKQERLFDSVSVRRRLADPATGLLIGARIEEEPGAVFFDSKLQARYEGTRKAFPGYQTHLESYSRNLDRLVVLTDGGDDSGTYWTVDIASGKASELGHPYAEIKPADVGPTRAVKYAAADGTPIEGILTLPPGRKPEKLPLVVMPHGGPIDFNDSIGFDWWAQAYAAAGYAVLQPNYRGSSGYGRAFREAGFGQWGGKMLSDISDGIAPLAEQGLIDPKRVCIVGASYGGYAALAGVTLQKGIYRCAVSVGGVSDMSTFFDWNTLGAGKNSGMARYIRSATGADKEGDDKLSAISPAHFADHADAPILLIHGRDDTRVPIEQSETMAAALKHAGKPFDLVIMKGEDHFLSREETRIAMLKAAVEFVKHNNPPD